MNKFLAGGMAGLVAGIPMAALMELLHRWPRREREPLPPRQITVRIARAAGLDPVVDEPEERTAATVASHFGYAATMGVLYAALAQRASGHPAFKGAAFGFLVYGLSYLGWLPATGVLRPATKFSSRRNTMLIVAHLLWGAVTGLQTERLVQEKEEKQKQTEKDEDAGV